MTEHKGWTSTDRDRRSQTMTVVWSLIWAGGFLLANTAIKKEWITGDAGVVAATVLVVFLGIGWVYAYVRYLRHADELVRKVQLEAMAVALSVGFLVGFASLLLESGGILEARPSSMVLAMIAGYIAATLVGHRRYS
ncbi:MAG: hypothetical protein WBV06_08995 [Acidimicrobiia bacterium]